MRDVIIIGGGVSGCASARELSRYKADILVLDKEEDVCCGTSKANSAIVHAGFDAPAGSRMAALNVAGSRRMPTLAKELDFAYQQCGSLVVCLSEEDRPALQKALRERADQRGGRAAHRGTGRAACHGAEYFRRRGGGPVGAHRRHRLPLRADLRLCGKRRHQRRAVPVRHRGGAD